MCLWSLCLYPLQSYIYIFFISVRLLQEAFHNDWLNELIAGHRRRLVRREEHTRLDRPLPRVLRLPRARQSGQSIHLTEWIHLFAFDHSQLWKKEGSKLLSMLSALFLCSNFQETWTTPQRWWQLLFDNGKQKTDAFERKRQIRFSLKVFQ